MLDPQITYTFIGQEYGWDRVSDADPAMLRQNRESMMGVLENPGRFPKADFNKCAEIVREIDTFFLRYGDLLTNFA
jgi:hypothetical protein